MERANGNEPEDEADQLIEDRKSLKDCPTTRTLKF